MHVLVEGLDLWYWPARLSGSQCDELIQILPWDRGGTGGLIITDQELVLQTLRIGLLPEDAPTLRWRDELTLCELEGGRKDGVCRWHVDPPFGGSRYKLVGYIDEAPGTMFGKTEQFTPPTPRGSVVLFDIRLEHRSLDVPEGVRKRTFGLRAT